MTKKPNGFTLIELLIVVMLIGILSGIALSVLNTKGIRAKARDGQRIGDLKRFQAALELYFSANRVYPQVPSGGTSGWGKIADLTSQMVPSYVTDLPADPLTGNSGTVACFNNYTGYAYYYTAGTDGKQYVLGSIMEADTSASASLCSALYNCKNGISCSCTDTHCYAVQNPL